MRGSVASSTDAIPDGTYFSAQKRGPYSATNMSNPMVARLRHWDAVGRGRPRKRMKPYSTTPATKKRVPAAKSGGTSKHRDPNGEERRSP